VTPKTRFTFIGLAVLTVLMPWLIVFVGRGVFILCTFCLLVMSLLISSVALVRKDRQLAIAGLVALLLTFLSMLIAPNFSRGG